ncbi:MAG TPA: hypothetical protein VJQ43_06405 [Thermoplasmata archaeon]|nr:hypothetical protein [Thermoplasmata archaeon]
MPPATPCDGPYPSFAGYAPYPVGCVGRDQAVAGFYSNVVGGAGNVSVQLTLPVDRSPAANQSDLYRAIWLGLVLADPYSWMSQCFLEVRFQPDSSYANGTPTATLPNNWTGAVVGYATDPNTSAEDACFEQPLTLSGGTGGAYLNAHGGDTLNITTLGWAGSGSGEQVTVVDTANGQRSQVRGIFDQGAPLDPAFTTSNVLDGLASAGAQFTPVSFGVELAGGANPSVRSNSSFGGCTPGVPPPTKADGSVPCPSYDPASWVNDTAAPILLSPPVFSAGATSARASELRLASTTGGVAGLGTLSNGTCTGRTGSAYCTYPWFSYSCGAGALEFGATDYSGVTSDFGKQNQFPSVPSPGLLGYGQYPSAGFALPGCGAGTHNVTVGVTSGSGVVEILGANYTTPATLALPAGAYSIAAQPAPGYAFTGWTTTGTVALGSVSAPSTSLVPSSGGSALARFSATATPSTITFGSSGGNASFEVGPPAPENGSATPVAVPIGGSLALAPGAYPVLVEPQAGSSLGVWTTTGSASVAETSSPATWLTILAGGGSGTLTAGLSFPSSSVTLRVTGSGNGTVTLNGSTLPYYSANATSFGSLTAPPGAFSATATAAPGWAFLGWHAAPGAVALADSNLSTVNVTLAYGTGYLYATFAAKVTIVTSPVAGGSVSVNNSAPVGNGTVLLLTRGTYALAAVPAAGNAFQHWRISDPKALQVTRPAFPLTRLLVNSSATLTVDYAPQFNETVTFNLASALGGTLQFNYVNLSANSTVNTSIVNTTYELKAFAGAAYRFAGYILSGPVAVSGGELTVSGTGGVVTAKFVLRLYPVTFIATVPGAVTLSVNGNPVASGATLALTRNVYNLSATVVGSRTSFVQWSSLLSIANVSPSQTSATVKVNAPGTVIGIVATFLLNRLGVVPAVVDVGSPTHLNVFVNGSGALSYRYFGLPPGCSSGNAGQLNCTPSLAGSYLVHALVTDSGGAQEATPGVLLTVVGDPQVAGFSVGPSATDVGFPVNISLVPQLGIGPYSFSFANLPSPCVSVDLASFTCTPDDPGSYRIAATIVDSFGHSAFANATLLVNAGPAVGSMSLSRSATDVGVPVTVAVSASGGTGGLVYTYSGLPSGCSSTNGPALTCASTSPGSATITVLVSDAFGLSASSHVGLTVNPRPYGASVAVFPETVTIGESIQVAAHGSGGTGGLRYTYTGLPGGCASANATSLMCSPSTTGSYTIGVSVSDLFGFPANASAPLTVNATVGPGPNPPGPLSPQGIDWWYVALIALGALVVALILVWRFGRPPPEPVSSPPEPDAPA